MGDLREEEGNGRGTGAGRHGRAHPDGPTRFAADGIISAPFTGVKGTGVRSRERREEPAFFLSRKPIDGEVIC
jgi:hypothetical protein